MAHQIFAGLDRPELVIPPRDDRRRVLLIGGSNVQILPEAVLAEQLVALTGTATDDASWEILNLGRQGYGSERLSILLRQAMVLEPDVVVIYSGHNEFVERGFREALGRSWGNPVVQALADLLDGTRTFNALVSSLSAPPQRDTMNPDQPPEDVGWRDPGTSAAANPAALRIPWEETQLYWDAYRRNLQTMCETALAGGAGVVLCTVVGNDLWHPVLSTPPTGVSEAEADALSADLEAAQALIPPAYRAGILPPLRLRANDWYHGQGLNEGEDGRPRVAPRLRVLMGPLAEAPPTHGPTRSPPGRHWPPPIEWNAPAVELMKSMDTLTRRAVDAAQRARLERATALLDALLARAPDLSGALYTQALVVWLLGGDDARAAALFRRAAATDRAPKSGNDHSNDLVRAVAAREPDVVFFDARAWIEAATPEGLVGYELVMDACHLQPGVRHELLEALAPAVREAAARATR